MAALVTVRAGAVCTQTGWATALVIYRAKAVRLIRHFMGLIVRKGRGKDENDAASSRIEYYYFDS